MKENEKQKSKLGKDKSLVSSNAEEMAQSAKLIYVTDQDTPHIRRRKHGKKFRYFIDDKPLKDPKIKDRINKLVIPPAWNDVWICSKKNGHLQATGYDSKGRKQYLYHPEWIKLRQQHKFHRMSEFAQSLPLIRKQVKKDLARRKLSSEKVLATVLSLMEQTNIRVGNDVYEKLYGSYGLTTLKNKHIKIKGNTINFSFKGKKGVYQDLSLNNSRLARIVQQCKEIPGKELFQYYEEDGSRHSIDSGMVNEYLQSITGNEFSAKDFRTWSGTVNMFIALHELGCGENQKETHHNTIEALDKVSRQLGNTRAVCKKYYVHPLITELYESGKLSHYFEKLNKMDKTNNDTELTETEKMILAILKKHNTPT